MKTTLILFITFYLLLISQPIFALGYEAHISKIGNNHPIISEKKASVTHKWVDKLADSKVGKWAFKIANRVFSAKELQAGGFCLGFFLGLLGVLIAYLGEDKDMIKSAWIGLITAASIWFILILYLFIKDGFYFDYGFL